MSDERDALQTQLPPPGLKEAPNGVLYVGKLIEFANGLVPLPETTKQGDEVTLTLSNSKNAWQWSNSVILPSPPHDQQLEIKIPKAPFEAMLDAGTGAILEYSIKRSGITMSSSPLNIELEN